MFGFSASGSLERFSLVFCAFLRGVGAKKAGFGVFCRESVFWFGVPKVF